MFKVNNKDTRETPIKTHFMSCTCVSIVNFEYVLAGWDLSPTLQLNTKISQQTFTCLNQQQKHQKKFETYSKLTINTQKHCNGVVQVSFCEHIFSSVSNVDFEQVIICWGTRNFLLYLHSQFEYGKNAKHNKISFIPICKFLYPRKFWKPSHCYYRRCINYNYSINDHSQRNVLTEYEINSLHFAESQATLGLW